MKILIYSQYFYPETNACANRLIDIANFLSKKHSVVVMTSVPNHPRHQIIGNYKNKWFQKEIINNFTVLRNYTYVPKNLNNKIQRLWNYLTFAFSSLVNFSKVEKPDLIISSCPPIATLILGAYYAKKNKVRFMVDLRDLWPEAIKGVKIMKGKFLYNIFVKLAKRSYELAEKIIINSTSFKDVLVNEYNINENKIKYIPNGFNINEYKDYKIKESSNNDFIIGYSGLLGLAQNTELIVKTAKLSKERNLDIKFWVIGDGTYKQRLIKEKKELELDNLIIFDYRPKYELYDLINDFDLALITYQINDTFRQNIPSKIFDYWFLERPVLINLSGVASQLIKDSGSGFVIETDEEEIFLKTILEIKNKKEELKTMGKNGKCYLLKNFNKEDLLVEFEENIE